MQFFLHKYKQRILITVSRLDLTNFLTTKVMNIDGVGENMAINHKMEFIEDPWPEIVRPKFTIADSKENRLLNSMSDNGKYCTEETSCCDVHAYLRLENSRSLAGIGTDGDGENMTIDHKAEAESTKDDWPEAELVTGNVVIMTKEQLFGSSTPPASRLH